MACQSIAPSFSFTTLEGASSWPVSPGSPKNVLGNEKGASDPLKKIIGFSCNLGLGDQSSTLSIELSGFHGDAEATIGKLAIFKCDEFGFGGMIKSLVHTENPSGQKTKIDMVDCKEAFARYDLFINEFHSTTDLQGSTTRIQTGWNAKNIHRVIEGRSWGSFISNSYDGAGSVNPSNYGKVLPDVNGRNCVFFGSSTEGKVSQGTTTYAKILQALVDDPAYWYNTYSFPLTITLGPVRNIAKNEIPYVGTSAKSMTLLELINNVCEEAGYDWTFHTPVGNAIHIRFIDKKKPTTFGEIKNRIEQAKSNNKLLNYSIGAEFKNEKTRRIVIGSKVNYIKEMYFQNEFQPAGKENNGGQHTSAYVLGFNTNNWPVLGYTSSFNVPINVRTLRAGLRTNGFEFYDDHILNEAELLATGTMETWKLYGILYPNSISRSCMNFLGIDWSTARSKVFSSFGGNTHIVSQACVEAVKFTTRKSAGELVYEEICYSWIKNFYDTFYGKYYMVFLPKNTCFFDMSGLQQQTGIFLGPGSSAFMADEPTDSGWADTANPIGFTGQNRSLFMDGSGKTVCFCGIRIGDSLDRFMGPYRRFFYFEPSSLQGEWDVNGNHVFTRAETDGRVYNFGSNIGILIKMPNMIPQRWGDRAGLANNMGLRMLDLLVGDANGFPVANGTTDFSYTNVFKETLAAGRFDRIAIPMKSNIVNYGPWLSNARNSRWSDGGVELKIVDDLNPWSYGGYANMNTAGQRLAVDSLKQRQKYESGSITIAETPKKNMEAGGSSGIDPIISSIVCKLDGSGATTTYNYQTYVQKFGQSAESLNNYTKLGINARRANFNILKDLNLEITRAFTEGMRTFGSIREKLFEQASVPLSASSSSLNNVLIMSYPDGFNNERIEAGIDKKYTSDYFQDQINYSKYAIVSLDMIFSPVVTNPFSSSYFMPSVSLPKFNHNYFPNATKPSIPPLLGPKRILPIVNWHLNPYTNSLYGNLFGGRASGFGFDTEYVSFGEVPANTFAANRQQQGFRDSVDNIRGAALRGPLLLHSWGYDINGDPVPGRGPPNARTFGQNWLRNPKSWPCGPIDLRWDESRGVWVSPPSASLVIATMDEDLAMSQNGQHTVAWATVENIFGFYNTTIPTSKIQVWDFIGKSITRGTKIVAYYFGTNANYTVPYYIAISQMDSFIKADNGSCEQGQAPGVGLPMDPQSGYLYGFYGENGQAPKPALYDLSELFGSNSLRDNGKTQVLGFTKMNSRWKAIPCLEAIPIVDCSGDYPGGGGGAGDPYSPI